jgi:lipoic acid synthetase
MLLGRECTRNCAFCKVEHKEPEGVDVNEPENVAKAARELGLSHVVITSVTRDDLEDGGAGHFAKTVYAIREYSPPTSIELLIPDFKGDITALHTVLDASPDILNHNVETVPDLYSVIRPEAIFERSIELLRRVKEYNPEIITKSGFMLGLGESDEQVIVLLKILKNADCDIVTIGQYLQPSAKHYPVQEYVHPDKFKEFRDIGLTLGIKQVTSGPLVRSSYQAEADFKMLVNGN